MIQTKTSSLFWWLSSLHIHTHIHTHTHTLSLFLSFSLSLSFVALLSTFFLATMASESLSEAIRCAAETGILKLQGFSLRKFPDLPRDVDPADLIELGLSTTTLPTPTHFLSLFPPSLCFVEFKTKQKKRGGVGAG